MNKRNFNEIDQEKFIILKFKYSNVYIKKNVILILSLFSLSFFRISKSLIETTLYI